MGETAPRCGRGAGGLGRDVTAHDVTIGDVRLHARLEGRAGAPATVNRRPFKPGSGSLWQAQS